MKTNSNPLVSVIIPTKNEEKNIKNCLESLRSQSYNPIEVIVVDNRSTDKTKYIAKKYTPRVYDASPERSAQRNFGAKKIARGKYLLFLDSDMMVSEKLIQSCVVKLENAPDLVGLYINEIITGNSLWNKVRRFERSFYNGTAIDAVRFLRRDLFLKIGGFDEKLYACEDWDLNKRMKKLGKIDLIDSPLFHNEAKFNIGKYLDKKGYYSINFNVYVDKWGKNDTDVQKQFGPLYRLFLVFVENGKWKKLIKHPLLASCMLFLRILAGWKYIVIRMKVNL